MATRREMLTAMLAATAFPRGLRAQAPCPALTAIDAATAPLLALLPEAATRAELADAAALARCDDQSPQGDAALALALAAALAALPAGCHDDAVASARAPLAAAMATQAIRYGRNDPFAAIHRPYRVTAFAGPGVDTPRLLLLAQPIDTPERIEAWLARLDAHADALLAAGTALRADEAAGCLPPTIVGRQALAVLDATILTQPMQHPLVRRLSDPAAAARAATILAKRVQPNAALLRDTVAALTRRGRGEPGVWQQPQGEALYAANLSRVADDDLSAADAQDHARAEAERIGALLDKRLAARGLRLGPLAERIAAAFAARPALIARDDGEGRGALIDAAREHVAAGREALAKLVPPALATTPALAIEALPEAGAMLPAGSSYQPAGYGVDATLWLDTRSVHALPIPGVSPIAYRLGLPGEHLLASASLNAARPIAARVAAWPAMTAGWRAYAARLAAEAGLFAHDPWGDIARLADEHLAAARLVVDVGIHTQRWTRARATEEMIALTGAPQEAAIDRISALPAEAGAEPLGLRRLLSLRTAARDGAWTFDQKRFHEAVLAGGARPFALVAAATG